EVPPVVVVPMLLPPMPVGETAVPPLNVLVELAPPDEPPVVLPLRDAPPEEPPVEPVRVPPLPPVEPPPPPGPVCWPRAPEAAMSKPKKADPVTRTAKPIRKPRWLMTHCPCLVEEIIRSWHAGRATPNHPIYSNRAGARMYRRIGQHELPLEFY